MPIDNSFFHYGSLYHKLFDPHLSEACQVVTQLVADRASVLDIGCGTGQLCFSLREQKYCRVVGLDLSLRMLDFAQKSNPFPDLIFVHQDATDLSTYQDNEFDYATILTLIHELDHSQQQLVLKEALRVARSVILVDAVSPLPKNAGGIGIRFVESTFGRDHHQNFRGFLAAGGLQGILKKCGLPIQLEHSSVFWRNCREVVMVSLQ